MRNFFKYVIVFCLVVFHSEIMAGKLGDKIKAGFQSFKEKVATKFHKEPKETTEATPLSADQKNYIKNLETIKKALTTLIGKIKSVQAEMEKAEKKHKLEGDTSLWMMFQLHISIVSAECTYFLRFVTELHSELSTYNKQARRKGEVEQSVVDYIKRAIDNFCCTGRKINIASARGIFILAMQYILQNPTCPQTGRTELNTILSGKHLQILAKNKDFSGLLEDVKTSLYSLLDILASMSLLADGNSEPDESETAQAKSRFISNIEGFDAVLSAVQDIIVYIKGGRLSESAARSRFQQLAGNVLLNSSQSITDNRRPQYNNGTASSSGYSTRYNSDYSSTDYSDENRYFDARGNRQNNSNNRSQNFQYNGRNSQSDSDYGSSYDEYSDENYSDSGEYKAPAPQGNYRNNNRSNQNSRYSNNRQTSRKYVQNDRQPIETSPDQSAPSQVSSQQDNWW